MKFIVYNVRDDEIPFVQKWGKDHGVEVAYTTTTLNQETVEEANGFDGIFMSSNDSVFARII